AFAWIERRIDSRVAGSGGRRLERTGTGATAQEVRSQGRGRSRRTWQARGLPLAPRLFRRHSTQRYPRRYGRSRFRGLTEPASLKRIWGRAVIPDAAQRRSGIHFDFALVQENQNGFRVLSPASRRQPRNDDD